MTAFFVAVGALALAALARGVYVYRRTGREERSNGRHHR